MAINLMHALQVGAPFLIVACFLGYGIFKAVEWYRKNQLARVTIRANRGEGQESKKPPHSFLPTFIGGNFQTKKGVPFLPFAFQRKQKVKGGSYQAWLETYYRSKQ